MTDILFCYCRKNSNNKYLKKEYYNTVRHNRKARKQVIWSGNGPPWICDCGRWVDTYGYTTFHELIRRHNVTKQTVLQKDGSKHISI